MKEDTIGIIIIYIGISSIHYTVKNQKYQVLQFVKCKTINKYKDHTISKKILHRIITFRKDYFLSTKWHPYT